MKKKKYHVSDILAILGISRKTLYIWELKRKIKFKREANGYRFLNENDIKKMRRGKK